MRKLFFGAALLAIAFVGCSTIISAALSAAPEPRPQHSPNALRPR